MNWLYDNYFEKSELDKKLFTSKKIVGLLSASTLSVLLKKYDIYNALGFQRLILIEDGKNLHVAMSVHCLVTG